MGCTSMAQPMLSRGRQRNLYIKSLVWLGLKFEKRFIRELAKVEYGVAYYARKLSFEFPRHEQQLILHASQEKAHGRMLAALIDELPESKGGLAKKQWSFSPDAGKTRVEGLSHRYFVMRQILGGKKLSEHNFLERLAIMAAFESISISVYQEIYRQSKCTLKRIALRIVNDEESHQSYLTDILSSYGVGLESALAWEQRILNSIPCVILDFPKLLFN